MVIGLGGANVADAGDRNPGVFPVQAHAYGKTYGEWGADWWKALFAIPVVNGDHPFLSGGAFAGEDGVLFLAPVEGSTGTINLTIPTGTALFFPVVNAECSTLEGLGTTEAELRACANGFIDGTSGRFAEIDGNPVNNLDAYRVQSPLFVFGPLPENNLLEFFGLQDTVGATSISVDAGVYLFLAPLSVGQHVLHTGGTFDDIGVSIDTTFNITVVPKKP